MLDLFQRRRLARIEAKLDIILARQQASTLQERQIMATEQDILDKVTAQGTVVDSVVALVQNLSQQIKDAGTDPVKLQAISDMLDAQDAKLAAAVTANTPAPPTE